MFGKKVEVPIPPRRSRPQRRPVVERFLKKNLGDPMSQAHDGQKDKLKSGHCCIEDCMKHVPKEEMDHVLGRLRERHLGKKFVPNLGEAEPRTSDMQSMKLVHGPSAPALSYCCIEECMKHVPKTEMDRVLERLSGRRLRGKNVAQSVHLKDDSQDTDRQALDGFFEKMKISGLDGGDSKDVGSKNTSEQSSWQQEGAESGENTNCDIKIKTKPVNPGDKLLSAQSAKVRGKGDSKFSLKDYKAAHLLADKFSPQSKVYRDQSSSHLSYPKSKMGCAIESGPKSQRGKTYQQTTSKSALQSNVHPKYCSVNIKKCGGFLSKSDELTDERELPGSENNNQTLMPDELYEDQVHNEI